MRKILLILFAWIIFLNMPLAIAYSIEEDEWPFLPVWCDYTQYGRKNAVYPYGTHIPPVQVQSLIDRMGQKTWLHIHHYCMALANIYRSHGIGLTESQRTYELLTAIGGIDYVLKRIPEDSILMSELLTKKGYVLLQLKRYVEAERSLNKALSKQYTYWPTYGYLADVYLAQGQIDKAKRILQKGLRVAPNAKGLKKRLGTVSKK